MSETLDSNDEISLEPTVADPSVIVGMACRVPGATNPSQLWSVLAEKKDLQRKIPEDRFNVDAFYHPRGANKGTVSIYLS
jgi:acyl transferase domain-containing protein